MARTYCWQFKVKTYETDRFNRVSDGFYINFLQETATQASTDAGYPLEWYLENHRLWLIQKLTLRYDNPALVSDELEVITWVADFKRVQSHRDYIIRRVSDNASILRARANWVFIDLDQMMPTRIPLEMTPAFDPHKEPLEPLPVILENAQPLENPLTFIEDRRVQYYEIDMVEHVNNGVYPRWIEHAIYMALRHLNGSVPLEFSARQIEYLKAAQIDDPIRVISKIEAFSAEGIVWQHEIINPESGDLLVKDRVIQRLPENKIRALIGY